MWYKYIYLLCFVFSGATPSITGDRTFPCRFNHDHKSFEEFRCENGTSCIHIKQVCDGIKDCSDASDEASCLHSKRRIKRNDLCAVPQHPANGIYEVENISGALPGQVFDTLVLTVKCRVGFGVANANSEKTFCVHGQWYQKPPKCERFCKLEPDPSVEYECQGNTPDFVSCAEYLAPGTMVKPTCKTPNYYSRDTLKPMVCMAGVWNYIASCLPECGRITPESSPLVLGGKPVRRGELPWHAGIYRKTALSFEQTTYEQICGGSLVSNNVVVSAAHCFWRDGKKKLPAADFAVAIGKVYRSWEDEKDYDAQKSDVIEIKIPTRFRGQQANYQQDIAILILATPFVYQPHIRPVCISYNKEFGKSQLQHGHLGKVAGWGIATADGRASEDLRVADIPYIDAETCIEALPSSFTEYITGDKFCAGYTNGTALCFGDSGGGLAFLGTELGIPRYYLRGIVSAAPNTDKVCNDDAYTAFTKVTEHEDFIEQALKDSGKRSCSQYLFQCADGTCVDRGADCNGIMECPDGSDETRELCHIAVSTNYTECILPPYPEQGHYVDANFPYAQPGQISNTWSLTVTCSRGYGVQNAKGVIQDTSVVVKCQGGKWNKKMPKCVKYCCLPPTEGVIYEGLLDEQNYYGKCDIKLASGAIITPTCNDPNYYSLEPLKQMECRCDPWVSGECSWSNVPKCLPECGRVSPQGSPLVIGGEFSKRGELPWHVGVYNRSAVPYEQLCGGTIITTSVVISAAHCFWNGRLQPAVLFGVAAGKIYRSWDESADGQAQKSEVKEIKIPSQFRGAAAWQKGDIAILILQNSFVFKTYLRPACLSFERSLEESQLQDGVLGKTSGWGLTEVNNEPSTMLKTATLPYINSYDCSLAFPPIFIPLASDKFCAGYTDGTAALCQFDDGGGLTFPAVDNGIQRYFLRGVTTLALDTKTTCSRYSPMTFTQVSAYEDLIKQYI